MPSEAVAEDFDPWIADVTAPSTAVYAKPNARDAVRLSARQGQLLRVTGVSPGMNGDTNLWWSTTEGYVARLATPDPLYLDFDLARHHRMYEVMMAFPQVPTPSVLPYEADADVVGQPFFVMERIDGVVPTDNPSWASEGFVVTATPAQRRQLWEQTVDILCALHQLPTESFTFLRTGNTIGCFYIESPAMRQLIKKLHCDNYETLVAASSIIRPR